MFAFNLIYSHPPIICFNSIPPPQVEWLVIVAGRAIGVVYLTQRNCPALGATALVIIVYMIHVPFSRLVLTPKRIGPQPPFQYPVETCRQKKKNLRMFTLLSVWLATLSGHVELTSQSYPMVLVVFQKRRPRHASVRKQLSRSPL